MVLQMNELKLTSKEMPDLHEMEMLMKYCEILAKAPSFSSFGGMPGIFALVMSARELGVGPMAALNGGMYLIPSKIDKDGNPKGTPTIMMAARTMSMMIWKAGHTIEEIEASDRKVTLKGTRRDNGISMTVTMDMNKAKMAGLTHDNYGKPKVWSTWFKNPEDMLWKTCVAKLGRRLFTDVIGSAYEPSEFEEKENEEKEKEKKQTKSLKGKNVPEVLKIEENKIEQIEYKPNLEEFILINNLDNPESLIYKYVEMNAIKRNIDFDEMVNQCFENSESFLQTFELYKSKLEKQSS
jgi:hypothetical protein